jgi:hypothetical protein
MAFTAPRSPLAPRSDGEYRTSVDVTALTRQPMTAQAPAMPPPAGATPPPEAGTSPGAAAPGVVVVPTVGTAPPAGATPRAADEPQY